MIQGGIILVGLLGTMLGFAVSSPAISICGIFPLVCSLWKMSLRERRIRKALESLIERRPDERRTPALSASELIEALRYRSALEQGRQVSTCERISNVSAHCSTSNDGEGAIDVRIGPTRCSAVLLARIEPIAGRQEVLLQGRGSKGKAFEHCLREFVSPYLLRGEPIGFGVRDECLSKTLFSGFSQFGFNFTVCFPVMGTFVDGPVRQVLWCGYAQTTRPTEREVSSLARLSRELSSELSSSAAIRALTKRATVAEAVSREKTDFIAQMSHDMRSPLYNVKSILNLLQLENTDAGHVELLQVAQANCSSLEELVEDVLDLSRHRVGKLTANSEAFDLAVCVYQVAENFAVAAKVKGIELSVSSAEEQCPVFADRRQVKRIIANVIGNAIKYTQAGFVSVRLVKDGADNWSLIVRDSGCGMSESDLGRLFTPFSRFKSESVEGIGLGLSISKILAELNGGTILARSELQRGSEFVVNFPRWRFSSEAEFPAMPALACNKALCTVDLSVLVVDDDPGCVDSLGRLLDQTGCKVLKAYSVREALSIMNFDAPSCVISDGQMPDGGALRLLSFIQDREPQLPVLVLSGEGSIDRTAEFAARGASRVLTKPADFREIHDWLRALQKSFSTTVTELEQSAASVCA